MTKLIQVKTKKEYDVENSEVVEVTMTEAEFISKYEPWLHADFMEALDCQDSFCFEINRFSKNYTTVYVKPFDELDWAAYFNLSGVNEGAD